MNNFLTRSVRIQVQNNQNNSRGYPPCSAVFYVSWESCFLKDFAYEAGNFDTKSENEFSLLY